MTKFKVDIRCGTTRPRTREKLVLSVDATSEDQATEKACDDMFYNHDFDYWNVISVSVDSE